MFRRFHELKMLRNAGGPNSGAPDNVKYGMKRILMITVLFSALGAIKTAANPQIRRPVKHFIHFYRQTDDDMGFFPRAVYSWLMAKKAG